MSTTTQYINKGQDGYITGHLLVAAPFMQDPRFSQSVILVCGHGVDGAMGIVLNKPLNNITFSGLLAELNVETTTPIAPLQVFAGGPVETGRGFVIHSPDYRQAESLIIDHNFTVTATIDTLTAIAQNEPYAPKKSIVALGYAGWAAGQLEEELQESGWLTIPATHELVFDTPAALMWERAVQSLGNGKTGFGLERLSGDVGHA